MKLLKPFSITPFTRTAWVSLAARDRWADAVSDCSAMARKLELLSVSAEQRRCSWQTVMRVDLPSFSAECAGMGLCVLPVQWVGSFDGFIHYTPPGDSSVYCIVARKIEDALAFRDAFMAGDHEAQGDYLGFPPCCRKAFAANWSAGIFDPIWQAAEASSPEAAKSGTAFIDNAHPYSNPLLRYIGLRVGFHIPHSFRCNETIAAGAQRLLLAKDKGLVVVLEHLISMPMRASLLHGILTVQTPIFWIITYSVPTAEEYVINVAGEFVPKEGTWRKPVSGS